LEFGEIPKTSTGKHQKVVLRDRALELKDKLGDEYAVSRFPLLVCAGEAIGETAR